MVEDTKQRLQSIIDRIPAFTERAALTMPFFDGNNNFGFLREILQFTSEAITRIETLEKAQTSELSRRLKEIQKDERLALELFIADHGTVDVKLYKDGKESVKVTGDDAGELVEGAMETLIFGATI